MQIMNFDHPDWDKFYAELGHKIKRCNHTHSHSEELLKEKYPLIDIEQSIKFLRSEGGYCDCEVMFNVDRLFKEVMKNIMASKN